MTRAQVNLDLWAINFEKTRWQHWQKNWEVLNKPRVGHLWRGNREARSFGSFALPLV